MTYDPIDTNDDGVVDADVENQSVSTEKIGSKIVTIGPDAGNKYQSLSAAMDDLRSLATSDNTFTLWFTGNLIGSDGETGQVEPASHVNVAGNGYKIDVTGPDSGIDGRDKRDAKWSDLTIRHQSSGSFHAAMLIGKGTGEDFVVENCTFVGASGVDAGHGLWVYDRARPTLRSNTYIAGDGANASGLLLEFGCKPTVEGGEAYQGSGSTSRAFRMFNGSPSADVEGLTCYGGYSDLGAITSFEDNSCPDLSGVKAKPLPIPQYLASSGNDSDVVDGDNQPLDVNEFPAIPDNFDSYLKTISIRILDAGTGTIDIGTTSGGSEIASGIDATSQARISPDFTPVEFSSGDSIFVTADSGVQYNLSYTVCPNEFGNEALNLNTGGTCTISNGQFISAPKVASAKIGQKATDTKRYNIGSSTFHRVYWQELGRPDVAIEGTSDGGAVDPIQQCAIFGTTSNIDFSP